MAEAIEFDCEVVTVKVMRDFSIEVTLGLPEDSVAQMAMLAEAKRQGIYLHVIAGADQDGRQPEQMETRAKRKPSRKATP